MKIEITMKQAELINAALKEYKTNIMRRVEQITAELKPMTDTERDSFGALAELLESDQHRQMLNDESDRLMADYETIGEITYDITKAICTERYSR